MSTPIIFPANVEINLVKFVSKYPEEMTWFCSKQPYTGHPVQFSKYPGRRETPKSY
jgi:hypothetical protein